MATFYRSSLALIALAAALLPLPAWAQNVDENDDSDVEPAKPAKPAAVELEDEPVEDQEAGVKGAERGSLQTQAEAKGTAEPAATAASEDKPAAAERDNVFNGLFDSSDKLGWDGSIEIDVGYARYGYELDTTPPERFYDFRGRFVLGPVLEHDFAGPHFFRATGQLVAWIREERHEYQVNADDVYVQVGRRKTWDLKLGRFESWSVYHKGLGFDRYTLEDTGALREGPFNQAIVGVDMYEVNAIYDREMAGKGAVHVYPLEVLGFELVGLYGSGQTTDYLGARLAGDLNFKFLRFTAGVEYRTSEPSVEQRVADANGVQQPCDKCSDRATIGYGGGAIVAVKPIELGLNGAQSKLEAFQTDGEADVAASNVTTTVGGYFEVDPGYLLFKRSLILGVGVNRTEKTVDNEDFERHVQGAVYIAYPLGFNEAMVKLVLSRADLLIEEVDTATGVVTARNNDMVAGRVRVRYLF